MSAIFKANILLDLTRLSKANSVTDSHTGIVQSLSSVIDFTYVLCVFCTVFSSLYTFCVLQSIWDRDFRCIAFIGRSVTIKSQLYVFIDLF